MRERCECLSARCQCCDPGCPVHQGSGRCTAPATTVLFRVDMEDVTGTPMCDECAADGLESGLFTMNQED